MDERVEERLEGVLVEYEGALGSLPGVQEQVQRCTERAKAASDSEGQQARGRPRECSERRDTMIPTASVTWRRRVPASSAINMRTTKNGDTNTATTYILLSSSEHAHAPANNPTS